MDGATKKLLADKVRQSKKLARLANMVGRLRQLAIRKQETKVEYARSEVTTVTKGSEVERLLPSEVVRLADPDLENSFYADMMDGSLMEYELTGKERRSKGPLIVAIDNSGSMSGDPEVWSKAFGMGMLQIAIMQGRRFIGLHFDTTVQKRLRIDPKARETADAMKELLAFMEFFSGGGTNFVPVLREAVKKIREDGSFKDADIVIITDDAWSSPREFVGEYKAAAEELGFHTFAVQVGHVGMGALGALGAEVYNMTDLVSAYEIAGDIYSKM